MAKRPVSGILAILPLKCDRDLVPALSGMFTWAIQTDPGDDAALA
jgi:hypothetical protein